MVPFCTRCGRQAEPDQAFCTGCGSNLRAQTTTSENKDRILGPDEKVQFQCSDAKLWPKESYLSIAGRGAAGAQEGMQQSMAARRIPANFTGTSWVAGQSPPSSRPTSIPSQPTSYKGDSLMVTDKRLLIASGSQVSFELKIDPELVKVELDQIKLNNENAARAVKEFVDRRKKDGFGKNLLRAYSPSALREQPNPSDYGARFEYTVLASAEAKAAVGNALLGREGHIELKLDVLNLAKDLEGLPRAYRWSLGLTNKLGKAGIRAYGLKFHEEGRYDEIAKFLQSRAESIRPIVSPYM